MFRVISDIFSFLSNLGQNLLKVDMSGRKHKTAAPILESSWVVSFCFHRDYGIVEYRISPPEGTVIYYKGRLGHYVHATDISRVYMTEIIAI